MTLEEARIIWVTLVGTDWVRWIDVLENPYYMDNIREAHILLRESHLMEYNPAEESLKIKCK